MRAAVACLLVAARANALSTTRRKLLIAPLAAPLAAPVVATRANAVEQQMRTSADISSYESATGSSRAANLGAGSISGKSRPYRRPSENLARWSWRCLFLEQDGASSPSPQNSLKAVSSSLRSLGRRAGTRA